MIVEYNRTVKILIGSVAFLGLLGCATGESYRTSTNDNGKEPKLVLVPHSRYRARHHSRSANGSRRSGSQQYSSSNNNGGHNNDSYAGGGSAKNTPSSSRSSLPNSARYAKGDYSHVPRNTDVGNIQFDGYKYKGLLPSGKGAYYKVGKPYTIKGYHYAPHENYNYNVVGTVSWYGPGFQGGKTANGEIFDTNTLAAASPILPLPSYVRVTNLSNGKQVIVRVNDRGPYASKRIMDLSKKAAEILDYKNKGTTKVRVEILADESKALKAMLLGQKGVNKKGKGSYKVSDGDPSKIAKDNKPSQASNAKSSANDSSADADGISNKPIHNGKQIIATSSDYSDSKTKSGNYYIQVGAYATEQKVRTIGKKLSKNFDTNIDLTKIKKGSQDLYRVRFNNIESEDKARHLADQLIDLGYPDPKITLQQ